MRRLPYRAGIGDLDHTLFLCGNCLYGHGLDNGNQGHIGKTRPQRWGRCSWTLTPGSTRMEVGPSAAPMMPMDAASRISNPRNAATTMVKKIPNWAAAPNRNILGSDNKGPKSIMAPIPMNNNSGKASDAPSLSQTATVRYRGSRLRLPSSGLKRR